MPDTKSSQPETRDWRDSVTWYTHETAFARLARFVARPLLLAAARVECVGMEKIPASGPCIVAANHISNLDVLYMGGLIPRFPHFMAKRELYRNPIFGWTIRMLGSFPVNRGEGDVWAIRQAGKVLEAGNVLFMFPEGTRSGRKAQLKKGKVGVVKLALEHQAPVVPAAISGTERFRLGWPRPHLRMVFADPLDMVALAGPPPYTHQTLRDLTDLLMTTIARLLPPEYRGVYADRVGDD